MKLAERIVMAITAAALALAAGAAQGNCAVVAGYPETMPDSDFADAGNGTVRHVPTGLVWKRCAEGQTWDGSACAGSAAGYTWQQAFERADAVNAGSADSQNAGQGDWRVPNVKELRSITERGCLLRSINTTQFPATPASPASGFWSSSPVAGDPGSAWVVNFAFGFDNWFLRDGVGYVRLVRAGQSSADFDAAITAPVLSGVGVSGTGPTATTLAATSDKAATGYWVVVARNADAPTAEQTKAGVDYGTVTVAASGSGAMAAATAATFAVSGLTAGTDYDLYLVAQDNSVNANFSAPGGPVQFTTTPTHAVDATASPAAGGTATCTPNPVVSGGASACAYTVNPGYAFIEWRGDCTGATCDLGNVTSTKSVTATFAPVTSYTGPTPAAGDATLAVAGAGCVLTNAQFIAAPAGSPANTSFPHGLAAFTLAGCTGTATVTVSYPSAIPAGAKYWKEVGGVYTEYPATIGANSVTFTLTDGGPGDGDGQVNGTISDPSGVGVTAAANGGTQPIPALGPWGLALLSGFLGLGGAWMRRRRA